MSVAKKMSFDELREMGHGVQPPPDALALYRQAFAEFKDLCLWNRRELAEPSIPTLVSTATALRREGNMAAFALAAKIEDACRAAV